MSVRVADVPVLTDLAGIPQRAFGADASWEFEQREGSTNRLTLTVPLGDAADVHEDDEILFRRRRFKVTEVDRTRAAGQVAIVADEAQVELAGIVRAVFSLNGSLLSQALKKALEGSLWSAGTVADDTGSYFAEFADEPISRLLRFLQAQSAQWVTFDSLNRVVSFAPDQPPPLDRVFSYGVGVADIEKRSSAPEATVLEPTGRGGMTIENVNGGKASVEDFGWYTGLGLTLAAARARFTKKQVWSDDRYVYAANLLRDAQAKLALLSRPKIAYTLTVASGTIGGLALGDRVWVDDRQLGIKLTTRVVQVLESSDPSRDQLELDYLPESFGSIQSEEAGDSSTPEVDAVQFLVKNTNPVTLGAVPVPVLMTVVQVIADTAFQVGLTVRAQITAPALVTGYFLLDGQKLDAQIMHNEAAGWVSYGLPFLATQIPAGSRHFDFYMAVSAGAGTVPVNGAEVFIVTRGALGGVSNKRPDQSVSDQVPLWLAQIVAPADAATVVFPIRVVEGLLEQIDPWMGALAVPADVVVVWFDPLISITESTVTLTGMLPGQSFTLRLDSVGGAQIGQNVFTADVSGEFTIDLAIEFVLGPGDYIGVVVDSGQEFPFTVV